MKLPNVEKWYHFVELFFFIERGNTLLQNKLIILKVFPSTEKKRLFSKETTTSNVLCLGMLSSSQERMSKFFGQKRVFIEININKSDKNSSLINCGQIVVLSIFFRIWMKCLHRMNFKTFQVQIFMIESSKPEIKCLEQEICNQHFRKKM